MLTLFDIIKRTLYLSIFIIPIPLGTYTIHNASSAIVALGSYMLFSLLFPSLYFRSEKSGLGLHKRRIHPFIYILGWLLVQALTYAGFLQFNFMFLWSWPTIGRDLLFVFIMYWQVLLAIILAYFLSLALAKKDTCKQNEI